MGEGHLKQIPPNSLHLVLYPISMTVVVSYHAVFVVSAVTETEEIASPQVQEGALEMMWSDIHHS